jgi:integrase
MRKRGMGMGRLEKRATGSGKTLWVATWTDSNGRRHRRALSSDRRVAERALASLIRDRDLELLGLKHESGMERRLSEIQAAYLADLETRATPRHVKRMRYATGKILDVVQDGPVRDFRQEALLLYRQRRVRDGVANRTVNLEVGAMKAMLTWAANAGLVPRNPISSLKPLPAGKAYERRARRALTHDELTRFLVAAEQADREGEAHLDARPGQRARFVHRPRVPQAPLWRALLYTGARWGELTATTWADFDPNARVLRLRADTTKNGRERVIPLVGAVADDLERLRATRPGAGPGDSIFLGPAGRPIAENTTRARWRFRQILKRASIEAVDHQGVSVVIHSTRHTFASELGRAGVGLTQAQHLLGHSDPKLTAAIYTHLGVEDLRSAVDRMIHGARPTTIRLA